MTSKVEQKLIQNGGNAKPGPAVRGTASEIEETLHEQVMSNICPICFEVFLPPSHSPFILFPCGHTFCKTCINSYAKQKKMCPFCRSRFESMAPNLSLQSIILSAHEKKDHVVAKMKLEASQHLSKLSSEVAEKSCDAYLRDYKMLDLRIGVMQEEYSEAEAVYNKLKCKLEQIEAGRGGLQSEKEALLLKVQRLQQELSLLDQEGKEQGARL